jgi:AraC-like DNA-binding protein
MENGLDTEEIIFQRLISDDYVRDRYLAIKEEFSTKKVLYKSAVKSFVMEMLIYLYREYTVSESTLTNKSKTEKIVLIKKAIRYIQDNYQKNITVFDTAEYVGLSKYYFCHIFKEFTGITTVKYINILRCENAKKILKSGNYRVEEVAYLCGFENLSYFSKTYKKYMGCLPSLSRKEE